MKKKDRYISMSRLEYEVMTLRLMKLTNLVDGAEEVAEEINRTISRLKSWEDYMEWMETESS